MRFTRPVPDFPARTAQLFFCAVPPALPADPEGVRSFPAAGPYYVAQYRPGQSVVLERNRFYRGDRPHHVDRFQVDLSIDSHAEVLARIERGQVDWGWLPPPIFFGEMPRLVAKYRVNRSRLFVSPGLAMRAFALNTSRPLFRNNPRLRQAVNHAIDRAAFRRATGAPSVSRLTDQYLPPEMPGYTNARIYPLERPNLRKARALAKGRTRGGKAVLYTFDGPAPLALAQSSSATWPRSASTSGFRASPSRRTAGGLLEQSAPFDIAFLPWAPDYFDPYSYLNVFFESRFVGSANFANFAHFKSPRYRPAASPGFRTPGCGTVSRLRSARRAARPRGCAARRHRLPQRSDAGLQRAWVAS